MNQMCETAKHPIWSNSWSVDPKKSPAAEKRSAIVICHGHRISEAMASSPTGRAILCGMPIGEK